MDVLQNMETTEPQRDRWKWDRLSQPFQTCVGPLLRDLDHALAELTRLTTALTEAKTKIEYQTTRIETISDAANVREERAREEERIAELDGEIARLRAEASARYAAVLAEREACAAWHDEQAEDARKSASPEDADNSYVGNLYRFHKFSAIAIRARPAP